MTFFWVIVVPAIIGGVGGWISAGRDARNARRQAEQRAQAWAARRAALVAQHEAETAAAHAAHVAESKRLGDMWAREIEAMRILRERGLR